MPSRAYLNFLHIRIDVLKLIETHSHYSQNKPGRKNLGYLTRSAVVMLCAAWERYHEDLLIEAVEYLCDSVTDASRLNKHIKKTISDAVKKDKNEIKPLDLAGEGWKEVWLGYTKLEVESLNTPKSANLGQLFKRYLGIEDYIGLWKKNSSKKIDAFVSARGEIAHNGAKAAYIHMSELRTYQDMIVSNVIETDSNMATELQKQAGTPTISWTQDYFTELSRYKQQK
jgi:RiboL-PSP-HEPN